MTQIDWPQRLAAKIGENLAAARKRHGFSAEQLSVATEDKGLRIPRQVITNIETGRRESVGISELIILAEALGIAPAELLFPADALNDSFPYLPNVTDDSFRTMQRFTAAPQVLKDDWMPTSGAHLVYGLVRDLYDAEEESNRLSYQLLKARESAGADSGLEVKAIEAQLRRTIASGLSLIFSGDIPDGSLPRHEVGMIIQHAEASAPDLLAHLGLPEGTDAP